MKINKYLLFIVFAFWGIFSHSQFSRDANGVTIKCPLANVGDTGVVDGVTYTKVNRADILAIVEASKGAGRNPIELATCCTSGITNFEELLKSLYNFNRDISHWDTASVTTMKKTFQENTNFNQDIGNWDVSNVTNMREMFRDASSFNQDIGSWTTSNVTTMRQMFQEASSFNNDNQPLNWNTSKVTQMRQMFMGASSFNQNIGNWNTTKLNGGNAVYQMFKRAHLFNNGEAPGDSNNPLNWYLNNAVNFTELFYEARSFNQDINSWNVSKVNAFTNCFFDARSFNRPLNNWIINTTPGVNINMREMFNAAIVFNQDISSWNTSRVNNMYEMFLSATSFNQNIGNWQTGNVNTMRSMFQGASAFNNGDAPGDSNNPLNWDTGLVNTMLNMFHSATVFNQDITNFSVVSVTTMKGMFKGAAAFNNGQPALQSGAPLNNWNTSNVTSLYETFQDAGSFNQDLGEWDVSNVTDFQRTFRQDGGLMRFDRDISTWCVEHLTDASKRVDFNNGATTPIRAEYLPKWGESCGARVVLTDSDGDNKLTDAETAIITATFNKDMNNSPQYSLNGGAYSNLTSTGDPKIWTFLLDPTSLYTKSIHFHCYRYMCKWWIYLLSIRWNFRWK